MQVEVQVEPPFDAAVDADWLAGVAVAVLVAEGMPHSASLTVVVMDDAQLQDLNRTYRQVDAPTDVLAFAAQEGEPFVMPEAGGAYLGDVIVSYPTALAQANEAGRSVASELALLVVHGCLHLLSYDHGDDDERACMWARQDEILRTLGYAGVAP